MRAVDEISFEIAPGEVVGFLGPNGAGKTTTLKMLSGLLYPTSGEARVLGHVPSKRERDFLRRITLVMGNRNQLQWDLPALDSFELNRAVYRIPRGPDFTNLRDELIELLDVGDLVRKPVRNLSLGERMKVEIVGSLLHRPQVLFLDEPTIGLDVTMQKRIRGFIAEYNRRYEATVLLTSHYMADVEALCQRVIVIHHGSILFDGELARLGDDLAAWKTIDVELEDGEADLSAYGDVVESDVGRVKLRVPRAEVARVTARLLAERDVADLTVEDPPIEDVIELVFAQERPMSSEAGAARSLFDFYVTRGRTQIQSQLQYRAATYFWMIGMLAEPIVYLVVWTTIAEQQGGSINGITTGRVRRVLHRLDARPEHEHRLHALRLGVADPRGRALGRAPAAAAPAPRRHRRLRRLEAGRDPDVAARSRPRCGSRSTPSSTRRCSRSCVFFFAIWGAYLIRTMFMSTLGMITFWTTRVSAIFEIFIAAELLLSGRLVPMEVMPDWVAGRRRLPALPVVVLLPDRVARRRPLDG